MKADLKFKSLNINNSQRKLLPSHLPNNRNDKLGFLKIDPGIDSSVACPQPGTVRVGGDYAIT
jgi:hypothetical protein